MANERLIMARFASTCTECRRKINVSDFIWFNPFSKQARHKKCNKEKEGKNE